MKWLNLIFLLILSFNLYAPTYIDVEVYMQTLEEIEIGKIEIQVKNSLEFLNVYESKANKKDYKLASNILEKYIDNYSRNKKISTWLLSKAQSMLKTCSHKVTILEDKMTKDFILKVETIAENLDIPANWLIGIMWHESRLNSKAMNSIGAAGLIQFLPNTALGLNTTTMKLKNMHELEQLNYVYKFYISAKGRFKHITDLYLYTFFPLAVLHSWPNSKVIECKQISAATIAKQNRGLDLNKDGKITVGEVRREVLKSFPAEIQHLNN